MYLNSLMGLDVRAKRLNHRAMKCIALQHKSRYRGKKNGSAKKLQAIR